MNVERWDTFELTSSSAQVYGNPFHDVDLSCVFTHEQSGKTLAVNGFYDGGTCWRVRFMPTELGAWRYVTQSADAALDRHQGQITCVEPTAPHLHGPLSTRGFAFFHADGTPRFLISTRLSCHLEPPQVWRDAIAYLRAHRVNRVLFMMGGVHGTIKYMYGQAADGPDFWRYDVDRFQAIDRFIDALRQADILASPYFYYFNDGTQRGMTPEQDRAYLRYGMARFGAYANVLPVLSNEVEQKHTTRRGQYDLRSHAWANEMGAYLKELSVFGLPVTVHDPMETDNAVHPGFYTLLQDWPFPWTDYMLRQAQVAALSTVPELRDDIPEQKAPIYNLRGYARHNQLLVDLRRFGQPVINEEPGYEMEGRTAFPDSTDANLRPWNSQTTDTLVPTFWTAAMAGGYVMWGNYATYWFGDPLPGIRRSETPRRLRVLHDFMTSLPYCEMEPANHLVSPAEQVVEGRGYRTNYCLAKPAQAYAVFTLLGGDVTIQLAEGRSYRVTQLDPRTGEQLDLGRVEGGPQTILVAGREQALTFRASETSDG